MPGSWDVRSGRDVYRELFTFPAFTAVLPSVLRPGGFVAFSVLNPAFVRPGRHGSEMATGSRHRTLAVRRASFLRGDPTVRRVARPSDAGDGINAVADVGFTILRIDEPRPTQDVCASAPGFAR